jgi:acyl carrier protein
MPAETDTARIEQIVRDALVEFGAERDQVKREASFEALDIDSLDLAELSQIVEEEFGVTFKSSDVEQLKTVGDALDFIGARAQ